MAILPKFDKRFMTLWAPAIAVLIIILSLSRRQPPFNKRNVNMA